MFDPLALVVGQYNHLPPLPEPTVEERIERTALEYGVDPGLALAVARAESNLEPEAKNPESSASGIYQFLDGTFRRYCVEEYKLTEGLSEKNKSEIQTECAVRMMAEGGISHWNESKHIWMKRLKKK